MTDPDAMLAELYPTGTYGRTPRRPEGEPDPDGPARFAELARTVAEIDEEHGYGVHLQHRQNTESAA
ncbi:hypothetical protein [Streptomyces seoulensis]|uniref:hypothetical protein n=1 Tax=Streptomyces seoulensis TaxID=73044 RepID=UPI001FCA714F|nr:hypothetical protein [Streptomyces seoulensis]BDH04872.1 hypothetical protein HEK131_20990 [Streptomyces seoulensis]